MSTTAVSARTIAIKPIHVPTTDRDLPLEVKVTAPTSGDELPVIVFSHGNQWSMDGYEPLVDRWAAAGNVVIRPTHLDSRRHGISFSDPRFSTIWRTRITDLRAVIDHRHEILAEVDALAGRVNPDNLAVVGHSWGAQSIGTLLGAGVLDADGNPGEDLSHHAVKAGVLIAATGTGDSLTPFALEHLPFMRPDYTTMTTPALVIAGDHDQSKMSTRGPDWFTDAYHLSPGDKTLLTVIGGEHTLGGIAGEAVAETTDDSPARVALVADAVSAYLDHQLGGNGEHWSSIAARADELGFTLRRRPDTA